MNEEDIKNCLKNHLRIELHDDWTGWENNDHILKAILFYDNEIISNDYIDVEDIK